MNEKQNFPPPWRQRNTTGRPSLGLIASGTRRIPPEPEGNNIAQLLARHHETFATSFLFVTWGTYFDSFLDRKLRKSMKLLNDEDVFEAYTSQCGQWVPADRRFRNGHPLRPGKRGGILEMAEHLEASAGRDRIDTLIFLTDPVDLEESYPEDKALFRSALRNETVYLSTFWAASHWAAFEKHSEIRRSGKAQTRPTKPEDEVLALIAHDEKKLDLCQWVVSNRDRIRRFRSFVTTGTTGEWVAKFLGAADIPTHKVELIDQMASGPKGGDVEIAGAILRRKVHHVVFFVDPMTSHPHEADIHALLRVCSMPDVEVNLRLNEASATSWINTVSKGRRT